MIAEYGDVPNVTRRAREFEAILREPAPAWNGKPLTAKGRSSIEKSLARVNKTLGQEAADRLDAMLSLAVGKPAPEIDGGDGGFWGGGGGGGGGGGVWRRRLKLPARCRRKVVVLVFWGSWCSPCMKRWSRTSATSLRKLKDQPFALLGVDCEESRDTARAVMTRERMTWPNWYDGAPHDGPIAKRYRVGAYPLVLVLDAKGNIRK